MAELEPSGHDAAKPLFSNRYKGVVLSLLLGAYTFNFIDRTIIATIGQAIKVDMHLTDGQLGLLGGLSFAVLYSLLGVPIARLAERRSRVTIISVSLVVWSAFTVACGFAGNFLQLLLMRVGVGVGEAGCTPPAHSLISDYFEPKRRASALSIYTLGIPLGSMFGAALGGWLALHFGWRVAFMTVGAPGLIIAILVKTFVKEPPRGHSDPVEKAVVKAEDPSWMHTEVREIGAVAKTLFTSWPVANMILGVTVTSFAGYGAGFFAPPYFSRAFGLDYATVGLIIGLVAGVSTGLGTIAGGFVTDWASKHGAAWYSLTPAIGLAIATPIYILAYNQLTWNGALLVLLIPGVFHYTYLAPTFAVVQNVVETRQRATAAAVLFLFINIIALGGGPVFTGWIIDAFAQGGFDHPGDASVFGALGRLTSGTQTVAAQFKTLCPGGAAAHGATAALAAQCKTTLITATRQGMIVSVCFYAWGAFHYLLGSFGLARALQAAAVARKLREA